MHKNVGLSVLLVSDDWAMPEPRSVGASDVKKKSHVFFYGIVNVPVSGLWGQKV
ncbi:MAG: hypothetical protein IKO99_02820 [Bacteroidales bacterium]|nr:hypothetical protein [Bacteroidales bacterium]